jgi:hypothetical protein
MSLSPQEQRRCVKALARSLAVGVPLTDDELYGALSDILVRGRWPSAHIVAACGLERRRGARSTHAGEPDGPPYNRPMADNVIATDVEAGARAMGDDEIGTPPERYPPP